MFISVLLLLQTTSPYDQLIIAHGFSRDQDGDWRNRQRHHTLFNGVYQVRTPDDQLSRILKSTVDRGSARAFGPHNPGIPLPTNFLLGRDIRYSPGIGTVDIQCVSSKVRVLVSLITSYQRVNGVAQPASPVDQSDYAMVEAVARWMLATKTAEAYSPSTHAVGNQSVNSRRASNVRIHLDAQRWSEICGYSINVNRQSACTMINRPQGAIIMPLGSPKVKVGNQWIDIEDVVISDGDRPMIPLQIINRL